MHLKNEENFAQNASFLLKNFKTFLGRGPPPRSHPYPYAPLFPSSGSAAA